MKKLISMLLIITLILSSGISVFAGENDPYEQIVEKYNTIYNVDLVYVKVSNCTDIAKYEEFIANTAERERATLDYIKQRSSYVCKNIGTFSNSATRASRTVTKTKDSFTASYLSDDAYRVTLTYTIYDESRVGNAKNPKVKPESSALISRSYSISSWTSPLLDGGRTIGLTTKGKLTEVFSSGSMNTISGVTVYAEFFYDD